MTAHADLAATIDDAWEKRAEVSTATTGAVRDAVVAALELLDSGQARVAEKGADGWTVNQWLKKAVLLSFRLNPNALYGAGRDDVVGQSAVEIRGLGENR